MNGRALAVAAAFAVAPFAANADAPPPLPPPPPAAVVCCEQAAPPTWTGFYLGVHGGGVSSQPDWTFPTPGAFSTSPGQTFGTSPQAAILGGQVGANYQFHRFLVGAEVSYGVSRANDVISGPFPLAPTDRFVIGVTDLFTATGRVGFVHDQYLFYGKAGYASSNVELSALSSAGVSAHVSQREDGWTVGGGLEGRVVSNVIFGLEYDYVSLGDGHFTGVTGGTLPGAAFTADTNKLHSQVFLARLSVLFGPHACCSEGLLGKY